MRNFLDEPGFGDRAAAEGEATHVPPDAEARLRAGGGHPRELPFMTTATFAVLAAVAFMSFLLLVSDLTVLAVAAPPWITILTVAVGVGAGGVVVNAWSRHRRGRP